MTLQDDINTQYWGQRGTFEPTLTGNDLQDKVNSLYWQYDPFYQGYKTTPQGGQLSLIAPPDGYTIVYADGALFSASFDAPDGTLVTDYTPDIGTGNFIQINQSGVTTVPVISGGQVRPAAELTGAFFPLPGETAIHISGDLYLPTGARGGLVGANMPASGGDFNFIQLRLRQPNADYSVFDGQTTTYLSTPDSIAGDTTYRVEGDFILTGTTVYFNMSVDGTEVLRGALPTLEADTDLGAGFYTNSGSSDVLVDNLEVTPITNYLTYGDLTLEYLAKVTQAGGKVSNAALDAVEALLYGDYDNGEGGTGNVSSILPKIDFFWAPVSDDFAGALVCLTGSITNFGFVSGDYSQSVGLTSSGTEYLLTNILLTDITPTDSYVGISTDLTPLNVNRVFLGRVGTNNELFEIRINVNDATQARYRDSTGVFLTSALYPPVTVASLPGVFARNADSSFTRGYSNLVRRSNGASSGLPLTASGSRTLSLFGRLNAGGNILSGAAATIRSVVIGDSLSDTERVVLTNALLQFDTDRSAL